MTPVRWYWGAVVRVDAAHEVLADVAAVVDPEVVRPQDPRTGHITLFYPPLRGRRAAPELADRLRDDVAAMPAFDLELGGFGEFPSPTRPVAWMDVRTGGDALTDMRQRLCQCDDDCHRHDFIPHLTVLYGEDPAAYAATRDAVRGAVERHAIRLRVDALWIAGFPQNGHPARDLRYVERLPLAP